MQKSGYFARAAPANEEDLALITKSCEVAVANACLRVPGVVGMDEDKGGELRCCEFERIKGGKHFDITQSWFTDMMANIGQSCAARPPTTTLEPPPRVHLRRSRFFVEPPPMMPPQGEAGRRGVSPTSLLCPGSVTPSN